MISRFEYLYIKEKVKGIENEIFEYEATNQIYQAWEKWTHLTEQEREFETEKWDKYYADCRNSFWGKAFFFIKERFYSNSLLKKTIDFLKKEAEKRGIIFIKKPDGIDPRELIILINPYFRLKYKLQELKKILSEYSKVYERNSLEDTI